MSRFTINGDVGDVFIRITKDRDVQLIFGEDDDSIYREVDWEGHEVYKAGVQFAMMLDSYLRNSKALLPIMLAGAGLEEFKDFQLTQEEQEEEPKPKYTDNIIQFKNKDKKNEDE